MRARSEIFCNCKLHLRSLKLPFEVRGTAPPANSPLHSTFLLPLNRSLFVSPSTYFSICLPLWLSLSFSLFLFISFPLSLFLSIFRTFSLYLSMSFYLSFSVSLAPSPLFPLYLSLPLSYLSVFLSLSLSLFLSLSLPLSLTIVHIPSLSISPSLS